MDVWPEKPNGLSTTTSALGFNSHERGETGTGEFNCLTCSQSFTVKGSLTRHHKYNRCRSTKPRDSKRAKVRRELNPGIQVTNEENQKEEENECQIKAEKVLRVHKTMFACHFCDYTTENRGNLCSHYRVHTGERPFKCPNIGCDYRARWVQNLRRHQRNGCGGRKVDSKMSIEENYFGPAMELVNKTQANEERSSSSLAFACTLCNFIGDSQMSAFKHACEHKTVVSVLNRIG